MFRVFRNFVSFVARYTIEKNRFRSAELRDAEHRAQSSSLCTTMPVGPNRMTFRITSSYLNKSFHHESTKAAKATKKRKPQSHEDAENTHARWRCSAGRPATQADEHGRIGTRHEPR